MSSSGSRPRPDTFTGKVSGFKQQLGAVQYFTLGFGYMTGMGWMIVIGDWLFQAGPLGAASAFVAGSLVMVLIGLCYAELSTLFPVSGGDVVYAYEIFGPRTSYLVGWLLVFSCVSATAFFAISAGWAVNTLLPWTDGPVLYTFAGDQVHLGSLVIGISGMALFAALNYRGIRSVSRFQDLVTYAFIGLSAVFIVSGLAFGEAENTRPLLQTTASGDIAWAGILAVFMTAPYWFAGFEVIPQTMGEKASGTSMRRAALMIPLAIAAAALFYVLVIFACARAHPWQALSGEELPAATAFEAGLNSPLLAKLVLVTGLIGLMTSWNSITLFGSRVLYAMGRARLLHPTFGRIHRRHGTPAIAVLLVSIVSLLGTFLGRGAIIPIVNVSGASIAFAYLLIAVGVIKVRRSRPGTMAPYRVPGGVATAAAAGLGALMMLGLVLWQPFLDAGHDFPMEWLLLGVWLLLGIGLWFLGMQTRSQISEERARAELLQASSSN